MNPTNDWRAEFDLRFEEWAQMNDPKEHIKTFIRRVEAQATERALRKGAEIINNKVKMHDDYNSCRESMWCECFGYHNLEELSKVILAAISPVEGAPGGKRKESRA